MGQESQMDTSIRNVTRVLGIYLVEKSPKKIQFRSNIRKVSVDFL